jgi:hypothetical protein
MTLSDWGLTPEQLAALTETERVEYEEAIAKHHTALLVRQETERR